VNDSFTRGRRGGDNLPQSVRDAQHLVELADEVLQRAVVAERARNTPWELIGQALGITRSAVHGRFAAHVSEVDDPNERQHLLRKKWLEIRDFAQTAIPVETLARPSRSIIFSVKAEARAVLAALAPAPPKYAGTSEELDHLIATFRIILADDAEDVRARRYLATVLRVRYALHGSLADLDEAIELLHPEPALRGLLGLCMIERYLQSGDQDDFSDAERLVMADSQSNGPGRVEELRALASTLISQERWRDARRVLIHMSAHAGRVEIAALNVVMGKGDQALHDLRSYLKFLDAQHPKNVPALRLFVALLLERNGSREELRSALNALTEIQLRAPETGDPEVS
jgi:hypothetical protein